MRFKHTLNASAMKLLARAFTGRRNAYHERSSYRKSRRGYGLHRPRRSMCRSGRAPSCTPITTHRSIERCTRRQRNRNLPAHALILVIDLGWVAFYRSRRSWELACGYRSRRRCEPLRSRWLSNRVGRPPDRSSRRSTKGAAPRARGRPQASEEDDLIAGCSPACAGTPNL